MLSIVIPINNEVENLLLLKDRIETSIASIGGDWQIVLVDDGSTDGSTELMIQFVNSDSRFQMVKLSRNFGHQAAISAGLKHARGDAIIVMDGDLQDRPEVLSDFVKKWRDGYEVVYGVRQKRKEGYLKKIAYAGFYRIIRMVSEIDMPMDSGDFCLMDRRVVDCLNKDFPESIRFVRGLRSYAGFRQTGVFYERDRRQAGKPSYSFRKLFTLAMDGILGFSYLPLRLSSFLGLFVSAISLLTGGLVLLHHVFGFSVLQPYFSETSTLMMGVIGLFFVGGTLLISIGVVGEYVGRIYFEVKKRAPYIIDRVYKNDD